MDNNDPLVIGEHVYFLGFPISLPNYPLTQYTGLYTAPKRKSALLRAAYGLYLAFQVYGHIKQGITI